MWYQAAFIAGLAERASWSRMSGAPEVTAPVWVGWSRWGLVAASACWEPWRARWPSRIRRATRGLGRRSRGGTFAQVAAVADEAWGGVGAGGGGGGLAVLGRQPRRVAGEVVAARQGGAVALLGRGAAEAVGPQEELGDVGAAGYPGQPRGRWCGTGFGCPGLVVGEAAQVGDGGGGDWLLAVACVGMSRARASQ